MRYHSTVRTYLNAALLFLSLLTIVHFAGCKHYRAPVRLKYPGGNPEPCDTVPRRIQHPALSENNLVDPSPLYTGPPITLGNFSDVQFNELTLDACIHQALANSEVLNKLGGVVLSNPNATSTVLDPALNDSNPVSGVEAALSAFDTQFQGRIGAAHTERLFNNALGAAIQGNILNTGDFLAELQKTTAAGTTFAIRNITDFNRSNSAINVTPSVWDTVNQLEIRQPLGRGSGVTVNRIAGPNAPAGQYNGVLISRIRSDISLADFETAVRNLVRDVETNYWELYFAYRNLDTLVEARDATRSVWENRKLRFDNEVGRPDDEAQARQQYFNFKGQAENALVGTTQGQLGVLGAERNLRRLMGMPVNDGMVIKPITEPTAAPILFDWESSQAATIQQRPEIRRQKWQIKQRELELVAAKALNRWQFDFVGQYGFRGFGDNLFGSRGEENGSAFESLIDGDLDDWSVALELNGPIGLRQRHLAVRNAELQLIREKTILNEQQRQLLHDLSAAYSEVDRALVNIRTMYNTRLAVQEELEPKRIRAEEGADQIFFLLEVQQRAATVESQLVRAIIDYNQALLQYAFTTGSLLSRYNIHLQEDQWVQEAQQNALEKAVRFREFHDRATTDIAPLTQGLNSTGNIVPANHPVDFGFSPQTTSPNQGFPVELEIPSPTELPIDVTSIEAINGN